MRDCFDTKLKASTETITLARSSSIRFTPVSSPKDSDVEASLFNSPLLTPIAATNLLSTLSCNNSPLKRSKSLNVNLTSLPPGTPCTPKFNAHPPWSLSDDTNKEEKQKLYVETISKEVTKDFLLSDADYKVLEQDAQTLSSALKALNHMRKIEFGKFNDINTNGELPSPKDVLDLCARLFYILEQSRRFANYSINAHIKLANHKLAVLNDGYLKEKSKNEECADALEKKDLMNELSGMVVDLQDQLEVSLSDNEKLGKKIVEMNKVNIKQEATLDALEKAINEIELDESDNEKTLTSLQKVKKIKQKLKQQQQPPQQQQVTPPPTSNKQNENNFLEILRMKEQENKELRDSLKLLTEESGKEASRYSRVMGRLETLQQLTDDCIYGSTGFSGEQALRMIASQLGSLVKTEKKRPKEELLATPTTFRLVSPRIITARYTRNGTEAS